MRGFRYRSFNTLELTFIYLMAFSIANSDISMKKKPSPESDLNGINSKYIERGRRYITFPEGSSLAVVFCLTTATPIMGDIFTHGIGFGLSYDLPNDTNYLRSYNEPEDYPEYHTIYEDMEYDAITERRRDRRQIYQKIEAALNSMGLDGRACMLQTLCEATSRLTFKADVISEILRVILTIPESGRWKEGKKYRYPEEEWSNNINIGEELPILVQYEKAFMLGKRSTPADCVLYFPDCKLSVLDLILPR